MSVFMTYNDAFVTMFLQCILGSDTLIPPVLLFLPTAVFDIWGLSCIYVNFDFFFQYLDVI